MVSCMCPHTAGACTGCDRMTEEWPLGCDKGGRKDLDNEVMFGLRFENQQAWQKRREGAEGARQWGNRRMIMKL